MVGANLVLLTGCLHTSVCRLTRKESDFLQEFSCRCSINYKVKVFNTQFRVTATSQKLRCFYMAIFSIRSYRVPKDFNRKNHKLIYQTIDMHIPERLLKGDNVRAK